MRRYRSIYESRLPSPLLKIWTRFISGYESGKYDKYQLRSAIGNVYQDYRDQLSPEDIRRMEIGLDSFDPDTLINIVKEIMR